MLLHLYKILLKLGHVYTIVLGEYRQSVNVIFSRVRHDHVYRAIEKRSLISFYRFIKFYIFFLYILNKTVFTDCLADLF